MNFGLGLFAIIIYNVVGVGFRKICNVGLLGLAIDVSLVKANGELCFFGRYVVIHSEV